MINMSRQVGTALGVSILVAVVGHPIGYIAAHTAFVHGWWTWAAIYVFAAVLALATARRRPTRPTDIPTSELVSEKAKATTTAMTAEPVAAPPPR